VAANTILHVEVPFLVASLDPNACHHCGQAIVTKVSCAGCVAVYCSLTCRGVADQSYHKKICGLANGIINTLRSYPLTMEILMLKVLGMAMTWPSKHVLELPPLCYFFHGIVHGL